jgi:hypothetical protein
MSDETDDEYVHQIQEAIRSMVMAQMAWYVKHGSTADKSRLVDLAAKHVAEKLECMMEGHDEAGRQAVADILDTIQAKLLPAVTHYLKFGRWPSN